MIYTGRRVSDVYVPVDGKRWIRDINTTVNRNLDVQTNDIMRGQSIGQEVYK